MHQNRMQQDGGIFRDEADVDAISAVHPEMTVSEFVERIFIPEHVAMKKLPGRIHYQAILKHIIIPHAVDEMFRALGGKTNTRLKVDPNWPYLGNIRLCDTRPEHIQMLIAAALARGYSIQTVTHIRGVIGVIFDHAKKKHIITGDNPVSLVPLPGVLARKPRALSLTQMREVLEAMRYPEKEITLMAVLTGMNLGEICGLQWRFVNLTSSWANSDGEFTPPRSIAIRRQLERGKLANINIQSRGRFMPIPNSLIGVLDRLKRRAEFVGPDDFVFVSDGGKPINEYTLALKRLKPIGKELSMPWLSWQALRQTRTNLLHELGTQLLDLTITNPAANLFLGSLQPALAQELAFG